MKIQLTGNLDDTTMRVDHPVRGLDPVLREMIAEVVA